MEESLRECELRNVYSYCELDDPKYQTYISAGSFNSAPQFRREFHELDLNQRMRDPEMNYNFYIDEKRNNRKTSRSQEKYII